MVDRGEDIYKVETPSVEDMASQNAKEGEKGFLGFTKIGGG